MDRVFFYQKLKNHNISYNHVLFHKDIPVLAFMHDRRGVASAVVATENTRHLPLPVKRTLQFSEEFVDREEDGLTILNEEGAWLVDMYLSDREVPAERDNYQKYISHGHTARQWMLDNHSAAFTDCYWTCKADEVCDWKMIRQKLSDLDEYITVRNGPHYKGHNSTLGGQLEKFWFKEDGELSLCKRTLLPFGILNVREVFASFIYEKQDFSACQYTLVRNRENVVAGCKCPAFTDFHTELVTAYDLLEEHNATQCDDVWERIIDYAVDYGFSRKKASDYLDMQTMVDFLVANRDRHQGNIGFLRDADTLQIFAPAPVYDSGSSAHMEGVLPERGLAMTVNGLYPTMGECLSHVQDPSLLDLSKIPSREEYKCLLDKLELLPERKSQLLAMYEEHADILRDIQRGRKQDYGMV